MKQSGFYRSSFGSVRLWLSKLSTDGGRQLIVHETSGGGGHVVQDMGPKVLVARATALFDYMMGDELSPKERLEEFRALVGTEQVLTHPSRGSYTARVGNFDEEIDDSGNLSAEVEFTATQDTLNVVPAGAASIPASGEGAVEAAADALKAERAELGLEDDGLSDAVKADVDSWAAAEDLNPRDVMTTTGKYTEQLGAAAEEHENDLARWETFKRTVLLADALRSAAESFTADTAATFLFRVGAPTALRSLIAAEYGAESADYYFQQVMRINDIATPGLLDEGMTLTLPAKTAVARNG